MADVVLHHDDTRPTTAALNSVKMRTRNTAKLKFNVSDAYGDKAKLTLVVATKNGKVRRASDSACTPSTSPYHEVAPVRPRPGKYRWWVTATDLAGNTQSGIVKQALVLTR